MTTLQTVCCTTCKCIDLFICVQLSLPRGIKFIMQSPGRSHANSESFSEQDLTDSNPSSPNLCFSLKKKYEPWCSPARSSSGHRNINDAVVCLESSGGSRVMETEPRHYTPPLHPTPIRRDSHARSSRKKTPAFVLLNAPLQVR